MSAPLVSATTKVPTDAPARVMTRLCKHFAHKAPVELDTARGRIGFRSGSYAELRAAGAALDIQVFASDAATLEQLFTVIDVRARIVPAKVEPDPSVAELVTCQKTLHG